MHEFGLICEQSSRKCLQERENDPNYILDSLLLLLTCRRQQAMELLDHHDRVLKKEVHQLCSSTALKFRILQMLFMLYTKVYSYSILTT